MEQIAINAFSPELKMRILKDLNLDHGVVTDLGGFESFVFAVDDRILRITHDSHRESGQIESELEFIRYLSENGAAVCLPNKLSNGELLKHYDEFSVCLFDRARGDILSDQDWTPAVIKEWGRCIGCFHRLTQTFKPHFHRMDWKEDENHSFESRIPKDQTDILQLAGKLLTQLERLPVNKDIYGLIHGDAHAGNFFKHGDSLTFFDFDDAIYMWLAYDIATVLFGAVLAQHVGESRRAQEELASYFLPLFLDGYSIEFPVDSFVLEEMERFLKLREFSLYAVIHAHMDVNQLEDWYPRKFMKDRQQRIANEEPFLDLNFNRF